MTHPDRALRLILSRARALGTETAALSEAAGRVLARSLRAACDLPPFDNSAVDGYALGVPRRGGLALTREVRAGAARAGRLAPGQAARIMTGAPLPRGADRVAMLEQAEERGGKVFLSAAPAAGDNVRRRGSDLRRGRALLPAGARLRPYEIALLASQGMVRVPVRRRPRVTVLVSGDELVDARRRPGPGRIRDSNGPALLAALRRWGLPVRAEGPVPDRREALAGAAARALRGCDVLVLSGGVSVGRHDHARAALEGLGMRTVFWRAAIKPGKPLLFGTLRGRLVFGLPGNPLSSLVCLEEFVRPALERMEGARGGAPLPEGSLAAAFRKPADKRQYVFCSARERRGRVLLTPLSPQASAMMAMASRASALAQAPLGTGRLARGAPVRFRWLT